MKSFTHIESLESRQLMHGDFPVSIDFTPASVAPAGGTVADTGAIFGPRANGSEYGWNIDSTANAVSRITTYTPYQRYKTFIDMLQGGQRSWDLHVHSGKYSVKVSAGDPTAWGGKVNILAEGKQALAGTTTSSNRILTGATTVTVTDGKLTLSSGVGATMNQISVVTIDYVGPLDGPPPAEPTPSPTPSGKIVWKTAASHPVARSESFGAAINGQLYVFGGYTGTSFKPTASAHRFDPMTNKWASIRSLPVPLTHVAHADDGQYIYFAGGYPGTGKDGAQKFAGSGVWRYNADSDTYTALPSLPSARGAGAMALLGRTMYFMGGTDLTRVDRKEVWSLDLDNTAAGWVARAPLPVTQNHPAAAAVDGAVYFIGGQISQDAAAKMTSLMWRYDPTANQWSSAPSLLGPRSHTTSSTFVWRGQIISMGGEPVHNKPIRSVDAYNPATQTWRTIGEIPAARFSGVGAMLNDRTFIFATGYSGGYFSGSTWIGEFID
ncbi:MAG: hypothetical protein H7144_10340 [Burkholderiales bacterium]|nr:hypothetical protein [Phycisphaerae bacterium]